MKDIIAYIETSKKKYPICFNLNVLEEIQDQYGSLTSWGNRVESKEKDGIDIKALKNGLMIMINEAIDTLNEEVNEKQEFVNDKQVGRIISEVGFKKTTEIITNLTNKSTKTDNEQKNV